ncbi:MAG: ATP-binding protein, partial [Kiloniellales bacterium]
MVLLDDHMNGGMSEEYSALQMGSLVKFRTPVSSVYGVVSGLSIPIPARESNENEMKIVELELLGEAETPAEGTNAVFQRGVSIFPLLGDSALASAQEDLARVYACRATSNVQIGTLYQDRAVPAFITIDDLLGKHFAIVGSTGTGKSCGVALIVRAILSRHAKGHVLVLDPHNEYARAFGDSAEVLDTRTLQLPYWLLTFDEFVETLFGAKTRDRESEIAILGDLIVAAKQNFPGNTENGAVLTVDTPIPYRIGDLVRMIDETMGKLDRPETSAPYMRIKSRLNNLQTDQRYAFMFPGLAVRDNMASILSRIFRLPVEDRPVTIVDLSGVPSEILNVVVSVLARMTFDFVLWSDRETPILLVCEEAHRYMPQDTRLGFEPTKKALSRIAKEGRKYGVSMCLVSQRPSELAIGTLSQCNTIFAMRLSNQKDQEFVRGALAESAIGLLDFLPSLRNAEAIVVGEGVSVPVRMCFEELPDDCRPMSGTASFSTAWETDAQSDIDA